MILLPDETLCFEFVEPLDRQRIGHAEGDEVGGSWLLPVRQVVPRDTDVLEGIEELHGAMLDKERVKARSGRWHGVVWKADLASPVP